MHLYLLLMHLCHQGHLRACRLGLRMSRLGMCCRLRRRMGLRCRCLLLCCHRCCFELGMRLLRR